jgi:hypothetical protein
MKMWENSLKMVEHLMKSMEIPLIYGKTRWSVSIETCENPVNFVEEI